MFRKPNRRIISLLLVLLMTVLTALPLASCGRKNQNEVAVFTAGDYIDPAVVKQFTKETGIKVVLDTFDTNEEMYPVIKNNNAILAFAEEDALERLETPCIRCARCVGACPVHLMPAAIDKAVHGKNKEALASLKVNLCIECGCCAYVCPANRYLVLYNRMGKQMLREKK